MIGDKLLIKPHHTDAARKIAKAISPEISPSDKYVIGIGGESGSGKSEIAYELKALLEKKKIKTLILHQDDYFKHPPKTNYKLRRKDISIVGTSEVNLTSINGHIRRFKNLKTTEINKPLVDFEKNKIDRETLKCKTTKVLIVEGTFTSLLKNIDKKIFLARTHKETLEARMARKRDKIDKFDEHILAIEHRIISKHNKLADIILDANYSIIELKKHAGKIKSIAMLTVHGYVDPKPILGKTDTGGQVTYVLELSKALAEKGIKVDIYTRKFQGKKAVERVTKDVRIIRIPCGGTKFIAKERLLPYLDEFVDNMQKFIKKENLKYNIYHSHYWDAGYVAMTLTERLGTCFFHTFHSLGAWKKEHMGGDPIKMEKLYNFKKRIKIEKIVYKKTRGLVMTSTDMIKHSKRFYNYNKKNYAVLPAGVNTSFFRPLKKGEKEKKIDVPQNYIFWVGRFATNKGLDYLLNAFAQIVTKEKDLFLVIGGGSKNPTPEEKRLRKNLMAIINKTHIKSRVFFAHHIKDELMPIYYRRANFFVLPSKFEPFGMTAAEAMACGTPLIASERAGITKYLKNKQNCLIVNPANKKDLAGAYKVFNRNTALRNKVAKNGFKLAKDEFSWIKIAKRSLVFYNRFL